MSCNSTSLPSLKLFAQLLVASCFVIASTAPAATIVYDNFDPTPAPFLYALGGNWTGSFTASTYAKTATTFVPTGSGQLDEFHLGLTNQKLVGSNTSIVTLFSDSGGAPGATLWTGPITVSGVYGSVASLVGIAGPSLTAGVPYWLEAAPVNDGVTLHGWYSNNQGDMGAIIGSGTPFPNALRFALQVGVKAVPEPATWLLGLIALSFAASRRSITSTSRSRRNRVR